MRLTAQDLENIIDALVSYEPDDLDPNQEKVIRSHQITIDKIQDARQKLRKHKEAK